MISCTRCEGTGFLNLHQVPKDEAYILDSTEAIGEWMQKNQDNDVQVCDCCGDSEYHYGEAGHHYCGEELKGAYDYNGGFCECH